MILAPLSHHSTSFQARQGAGGKRETADVSDRGADRGAAEMAGGAGRAEARDGASEEGGGGSCTDGFTG